ncbi:MAG: methyl-accepting chemotaxis protein [Treponema sp.]|jgi:methyl-accepting chemotaxis protein/iron only hydrogenase large subunit-like protein|nr:methyl-accepting chemotaxis protein [Treponema sp.]
MGNAALTPVIHIDEEKCINCYACITGCPVKYCMDGSGTKLQINHNLCIGCGHCIAVCTHKARSLIDDTPRFLKDLKQGEKMIAVVAPAIASFFPGAFLNLNGWLKSIGVEAAFDVSFGAELTVISYLDYINSKNPRTVIAQPCPAIVSFIQIYYPKLLPFLAPADSPMLHTIRMVHEYYPQYKGYKVAVISPCIAKRREFDETGLGDYNVTMLALRQHCETQHIDITSFPEVEYIGPHAERAVGFSSPGGLMDTAERFVPGIRRKTNKIEGVHAIYPYLEEMSGLLDTDVELSLLVDCLNCEKGCNGGPGTGHNEKPSVVLENPIRKRRAKLEAYHRPTKGEWVYTKYHKVLDKFWKKDLYNRDYRDLSGNNTLKYPNENELNEIYRSLKKMSAADLYNCTACGYGNCKTMATAIHNKLNKPENCAHYTLALLKEEMAVEELNRQLMAHIGVASGLIEKINTMVHEFNASIGLQAVAVEESSKKTERMVGSLKATSDISRKERESIQELIGNAAHSQESMRVTIQSVQGISQSVDGIASAIQIISGIAANTNLLSMNAAIEAAHAGDAGKGFAVVADEIRRLSESTRENSRNISRTLKSIIDGIAITSKQSGDTDSRITEMSKEINGFAQTITHLINTFNELSAESSEITSSLDSLKEQSSKVKNGYAEMLTLTDKLLDTMIDLTSLTKAKTAAH